MTAISPMADIRSLPDTVAAVLSNQSGEIPALLAAVTAMTSDNVVLAEWLAQQDAERIAAQSYWHHNGFAKLVLHADRNFRIRMHVWPAGEDRLGETNPHGHRWNFASEVLCGAGLEIEDYEESSNGVEHIRYCYLGGLKGLAPIEHVRLRSTGTQIVRTGDRHSVHTDVVHTVHPLGTDIVATLVVQSRALVEHTSVYCVPGKAVDEPIRAIAPAQVRELLASVLRTRGDRA